MFDMAAVALGNHTTTKISSNNTVSVSCSPSLNKMSHHTSHIQFSSPSGSLIMSPTNSIISSPASHSSTVNTTPNNHQIIPTNIHHHNNNLHIKKEPGLISPASGSENDQPPTNNSNNPNNCGSESINAKCKRKINFSHLGIPQRGHQPATVARRNARERNRVKQVNNGFAALKQHIPLGHRSKKMSKVETLRCAVDYIRNLKGLLDPNSILLNPNNENNGDILISDSSSPNPYSSHHHQLFDFDGSAGSLSHTNSTTQQLSPTSSEDPSSPSYNSEGSYVNASTNSHGQNQNTNMYDYENYEPVSPEDDELLDAISWWQQS